ncbi:hypothetical protein SUSAZ_05610 [Sulfolobus acidocaldarius SUSAZ]|nr:hypothetical protein SUSAZ_05610 [Sulfolobus acidocaldarius SUSAZ]
MISVEEMLKNKGINYHFVKVKDAKTVKDASNSLGVDGRRIAKTSIIVADNKPIAVLIRGDKKVKFR